MQKNEEHYNRSIYTALRIGFIEKMMTDDLELIKKINNLVLET